MKIMSRILRSLVVLTLSIIVFSSSNDDILKIENTNINKTVNLSTMAMKITQNEESRLYSSLNTYSGDLTGYVYNCPLCTGRLACMSSLDLSTGITTYSDETYGEVKIVASSQNLPCGSIVRFSSSRVSEDPTIAIVLDRGVGGNSLDLLVSDLSIATGNIGRSNITYDVLRSGWIDKE